MRRTQGILAIAVWAVLVSSAAAAPCPPSGGDARLSTRKPITGPDVRLVSTFGLRRHPLMRKIRMHTGIDWSAARGTSVVAAAAGRVAFVGIRLEYGRTVIIDHGGGLQTLYAHLADVWVKEGDCVANGAKIGGAGATGVAAATGVHFEVQRQGRAVDPMRESTGN